MSRKTDMTGVFLFQWNFIKNRQIHGSLLFGVFDGILFKYFVGLRLEIIHQKLEWKLERIFVSLSELHDGIGFIANL